MLTIGVCGGIKSGKTSFVNALCGVFAGSTGLQRETFMPERFSLRANADGTKTINQSLVAAKANNAKLRAGAAYDPSVIVDRGLITSRHEIDIDIIDFPGIGGVDDVWVLNCHLHLCDALVYMMDITCVDLDRVVRLKATVESTACVFVPVINKADNACDLETRQMLADIKKRTNIDIRAISAHKMFASISIGHDDVCCIPLVMINEARKVFKTANIKFNVKVIASLAADEFFVTDSMQYSDDRDEVGKTPRDNKSGDWNGLIKYLLDHMIFDRIPLLVHLISECIDELVVDELGRVIKHMITLIRINKPEVFHYINEIVHNVLCSLLHKKLFINLFDILPVAARHHVIEWCSVCLEGDIAQLYYMLLCEYPATFTSEQVIEALAKATTWNLRPVDYMCMATRSPHCVPLDRLVDKVGADPRFTAAVSIARQPFYKLRANVEQCTRALNALDTQLACSFAIRMMDSAIFATDENMAYRDPARGLEHVLFNDITSLCQLDLAARP